jgi:DNA-directed RNA polymerase specialized sigma24 family protein
VSAVDGADANDANRAIEELCRIYRPAVLAFATQALRDEHAAEDLTQEFFVSLLERRRLGQARRDLGKFRTFLLADFKFVLLDHLKRQRAVKRGGGLGQVSMDEVGEGEVPVTLPDPSVFDMQWALAVVREVVRILEVEEGRKKGDVPFAELRGFLPGFQAAGTSTYEELEKRYGVSAATLRVRVNRLRERFREILNSVLADTVSDAADLESERKALLGGLLRSLG